MSSTKKEEELLKKRLKKLFGNDPDTTKKNVERILKGSPSTSAGKKFFNRKQSSSSIFTSTSIYESSTKKSATKKKQNKSKIPNYNCSIIYPQTKTKRSEQKSQIKVKTASKLKATATKNSTTAAERAPPKRQRQGTKKAESPVPTKKTKRQKAETVGEIEWDPAWDRDSDQSRDPNCTCSACQTPSDCSCSHCEQSRQNGTKKKKKLTKKKNKSQKNSCNSPDFESQFNTSDFDSDFDPHSSAKKQNASKKTNGKKSDNSSKKEKSGTNSKIGKYVKKKCNINIDEVGDSNEIEELKEIDLNITNNIGSFNGELKFSNTTEQVKSNGKDQEKKVKTKKGKNSEHIKTKNQRTNESSSTQIVSYAHQKEKTDNVESDVLFHDNINYYPPKYCDDELMDEEVHSDDFDDYSEDEDDFDDYSEDEDDFDDYSDDEDDLDYYSDGDDSDDSFDTEEDCDGYTYSDFEDDSYDGDYQLPDDVNDDLYIASGTAVKYEINKTDISFDSDCTEAQIVEVPNIRMSKGEKEYLNACEKENDVVTSFADINSKDESDDSCPQLVPISYEASIFLSDSEFEEEEHTSDCYSMNSNADLEALELQDMENEENISMDPTICTTEDISDCIMPDFLELEATSSQENQNPFESLINKTKISEDCEVLMLQTEEKKNLNKYESGCEIENFKTEFYNSIDSMQVLVLLKDPIFIYGTLKFQLLVGTCEIFGYKPKLEEKLEIFSPRGYSFLNIQALKTECQANIKAKISNNVYERFSKDFIKSDLDELLKKFDEKNHAICVLERNDRSKKFDMLKKYMKQNLIPNMNSITLERPFYASEFILRCIIRTKTDNAMIVDSNWQTIQIEDSTKLMIIGGKSVGKSTLLRYTINKNLSKFGKMVLIDLDIGQPEIFVPQAISVTVLDRPLLGPGYFLNLQPKKTILFGDINVIINPFRYLEIIKELLEYCYQEEELQNIPWIINTMGYNKGVGSEIIVLITKYLKPTDVIQLQSAKEINNYDHIMYPDIIHQIPMNIFPGMNENFTANHRLILFNSIINDKKKSNEWDMKSKDMRFAILITRLGAILNEKYDWLTDCKPICASIEDVNIISFGEDKLSKQDLLEVINANLVYLCKQSEFTTSLECYGIGLVRGIDNFHQKIYLLPSIHNHLLENVNCLAVCNIPMPTSIYLNQGPKIKDITPYAFNTNETASSKYVTQIYYRPKHFLKGGMKNGKKN